MKLSTAIGLCVSVWVLGCAQGRAETGKPNVIMILMDDLGWRDLHRTGSTFYETPNIDKLAARGVMFPCTYAAAPICSPTRASIITGMPPVRMDSYCPQERRGAFAEGRRFAGRGKVPANGQQTIAWPKRVTWTRAGCACRDSWSGRV